MVWIDGTIVPPFDGLEPIPTEASGNQRRRMAITGQWQQQDGRTAASGGAGTARLRPHADRLRAAPSRTPWPKPSSAIGSGGNARAGERPVLRAASAMWPGV